MGGEEVRQHGHGIDAGHAAADGSGLDAAPEDALAVLLAGKVRKARHAPQCVVCRRLRTFARGRHYGAGARDQSASEESWPVAATRRRRSGTRGTSRPRRRRTIAAKMAVSASIAT